MESSDVLVQTHITVWFVDHSHDLDSNSLTQFDFKKRIHDLA
jgi:hypothetical protein